MFHYENEICNSFNKQYYFNTYFYITGLNSTVTESKKAVTYQNNNELPNIEL
jgi:hypothetical protein